MFFCSSGKTQNTNFSTVQTYNLFQNETEWGASSRFINDMLLDSEGIIWLGTNGGLVRWDGQYETFFNDRTSGDKKGVGKAIKSIFETQNGDLLILGNQGTFELDLLEQKKGIRKKISFPKDKTREGDVILQVIQDREDDVYVMLGSGKMVSIFKHVTGGEMKWLYDIQLPVSSREQNISFAIYQETCWLAIDDFGVLKLGSGLVSIENLKNFEFAQTAFFHVDQKDRLWLGTNNGNFLYQFDQSIEQFVPVKRPGDISFKMIKEDSKGQLVFCQNVYPLPLGQVFLLQDTQWTNLTNVVDTTAQNIYPSKDFTAYLFLDTENNMQTFSFVNPMATALLQKAPKGKWGNLIKGILEDQRGNIYFLNEINGFYRQNKSSGEIEVIPIIDEEGREIYYRCGGSLRQDAFGDFWFKACSPSSQAYYLVKFIVEQETFKIYNLDELPRDMILEEGRTIWITMHNVQDRRGHILQFDILTEKFNKIQIMDDNGLDYFAEPRYLHSTQDSFLWVGTLEGLVKVNKINGQQRIYNVANSELENDYVILIRNMIDGRLLIGTNGGGMVIFDPEKEDVISFQKNGPRNKYVCGALPIDSTHWWISTFNGLVHWDMETDQFTEFGSNTIGFAHHEFNRYAFYKSEDQTFYFGSVNGVTSFRTSDLLDKGPMPKLGLRSVESLSFENNEVLSFEKTLNGMPLVSAPLDGTGLRFNFYLADYIANEDSKVQVKLEGYDDSWQPTDEQKRIEYRFLPPGNYVLRAKGFSGRGVLAAEDFQLAIYVPKPIYLRWWFFALITMGILGIAWLISNVRVKRLKEKEEKRIEVNRKLAELELQALRAQLNPHFVSNALGAIQHTIKGQNVEKAENILTKFAHLMRLFLESSKNKYISLAEELELIQLYVEIEQLRFDDRFTFALNVPEDLDIYTIEIPSLLFQPFLENAINHGLFHKKGQGHLDVSFRTDEAEKTLFCIIEDDGIGRKRAAEIKKNSIRNYRSRATQIVNERLEIMKSMEGLSLEIKIIDLYDVDEAIGTRVEIEIPLE